MNKSFWKGKNVLITGHTGFKGAWLALQLNLLGANVVGYARKPNTAPNLFSILQLERSIKSIEGDVCDLHNLQTTVSKHKPDIIFHLAAQALVRESYKNPIETYQTNVMGSVNLHETARHCSSVKVLVNVTTDKCYENKETTHPYQEADRLGGYDAYSCSKACSELVTQSYRQAFIGTDSDLGIATARAGNVIGGGDWSKDRLIPDIILASQRNRQTKIRNPHATRPWQHVLDPINGYLMLAEQVFQHKSHYAESWNFGPNVDATRSVTEVLNLVRKAWPGKISWQLDEEHQPHEAKLLQLDSNKAKRKLSWHPKFTLEDAIQWTIEWYRRHDAGDNMLKFTTLQIENYMNLD